MGTELSGYRVMWAIVLFDIPVRTSKQRKKATLFRKRLLEEGFIMMQYSVYTRYFGNHQQLETMHQKLSADIPAGGKVDIIAITDKQYENIKSYHSAERQKKSNPDQLTLF